MRFIRASFLEYNSNKQPYSNMEVSDGNKGPVRSLVSRSIECSETIDGAYKAESAVCQSRNNTTSPPAAADSIQSRKAKPRNRKTTVALVVAAIVLTSACTSPTGSSSTTQENTLAAPSSNVPFSPEAKAAKAEATEQPADAAEQPKPSSIPSEEPKPKADKAADYSGAAYEANAKTPQPVQRSGDNADEGVKLKAKGISKLESTYDDGLSVSLSGLKAGIVKSEGPGYFTGAPYNVAEISISNSTSSSVDLSNVVVTLLLGDGGNFALPLYGEVDTYDFTGQIEPGERRSTSYAFIVPKEYTKAKLYVEIDDKHSSAVFQMKVK